MVSICLATYNGERFLRGQIESILSQLDDKDELVISDDKSKDKTIDIIKSYNDPRIKIFIGPAKGHPRFNFENCLKRCQGEYIFMCDQDDEWELNKVRTFLKYLKNYDLVTSDCTVIDGNGIEILPSFQSLKRKNQYGFWNNLINNHYLGCCMAFRKELLNVVLPFPEKIAQHDIWIGLCADAFRFKVKFAPEKLMRYRRYDNNFSQGSEGYGLWFKISYRLYFLWEILKRYVSLNGLKL